MNQELEFEAKSMLNEQSFAQLLQSFSVKMEQAVTQHNHYFETPDFRLKKS